MYALTPYFFQNRFGRVKHNIISAKRNLRADEGQQNNRKIGQSTQQPLGYVWSQDKEDTDANGLHQHDRRLMHDPSCDRTKQKDACQQIGHDRRESQRNSTDKVQCHQGNSKYNGNSFERQLDYLHDHGILQITL